jgi:TfoX/Sxy family transcriptional regulator of competence genes
VAYNKDLTLRIQAALSGLPGLVEKKMFGGVGFIVNGNMACGVHGNDLIVRVGPDRYEAALAEPHVKVFDLTGKPMSGWILVEPDGYQDEAELKSWVVKGVEFAQSLPPK